MPQGAGKVAMEKPLKAALEYLKISNVMMSTSDFYLTNEDQQALAKANPDNFYVSGRGPAGTHDIKLGVETITNIVNCKEGENVTLPQYDKSALNGQGDRIDYEKNPDFKVETGPVDLVLVHGWMVGHQPVDPSESYYIDANPGMDFVNEQLKNYSQWDELYDAAILVNVEDANIVFKWREAQEQSRRDSGAGALTQDEVKTFCKRFIPSYDAYMLNMAKNGIEGKVAKDRTLGYKISSEKLVQIDGVDFPKEAIDNIENMLKKSPAKTELLSYLADNNDEFKVKSFMPAEGKKLTK